MEKPSSDTSYIYILIDPRDEWVVYVGTSIHPEKRIKELNHKHINHYGKAVSEWALELRAAGLLPKLQVIEKCPTEIRRESERSWITHYLEQGFDLLNFDGVERKYGLKNRWE